MTYAQLVAAAAKRQHDRMMSGANDDRLTAYDYQLLIEEIFNLPEGSFSTDVNDELERKN